MPGFDGTGPMGMGSRTGGGRGFCAPGAGPAYGVNSFGAGYGGAVWVSRGAGRGGIPWGGGRGRAWGGGRGRGWYGSAGVYDAPAPVPYGYPAAFSPEQELAFLQNQSGALSQEIERIRARITELENRDTQKV